MKKLFCFVVALAVVILPATLLSGCGRDGANVIRIGATTAPHAQILEQVRGDLRDKGFDLRITILSDFTTGNPALARGDLLANFFQHRPFLETFNTNTGNNLQSLAGIHYEPLAIYPGRRNSITALQSGDRIIIPNDVTNAARALRLLEANGLVTWNAADGADRSNPANYTTQFQIYPVLASNLVNLRQDAALAVINGNWAAPAGLIPSRLVYETPELGYRYTNIIAIRPGYENHAGLNALVELLQTDAIRDFILNQWDGAVVPNFI